MWVRAMFFLICLSCLSASDLIGNATSAFHEGSVVHYAAEAGDWERRPNDCDNPGTMNCNSTI